MIQATRQIPRTLTLTNQIPIMQRCTRPITAGRLALMCLMARRFMFSFLADTGTLEYLMKLSRQFDNVFDEAKASNNEIRRAGAKIGIEPDQEETEDMGRPVYSVEDLKASTPFSGMKLGNEVLKDADRLGHVLHSTIRSDDPRSEKLRKAYIRHGFNDVENGNGNDWKADPDYVEVVHLFRHPR